MKEKRTKEANTWYVINFLCLPIDHNSVCWYLTILFIIIENGGKTRKCMLAFSIEAY